MGRPDDTRYDALSSHKQPSSGVTYDSRWAKDLRSAMRCSAVILCLLLLIDCWAGSVTAARAALWVTLAVLLFVILYPARVTAGEGWLASRGLVRERRVRTDALVSVRCLGGVSQDDLLVVGAGHRGHLHRALHPSVSRYCLAHACCPVLAVPPSPLEADLAAAHLRNVWRLRLDTRHFAKEATPPDA
ncbi:universal stress protein [Streptomyces sp. NPDC056938]|uniref:universal stress protein n=1 Tax=unclassified Streptomyces TaxID=2593676 RepID=UPI0036251A52